MKPVPTKIATVEWMRASDPHDYVVSFKRNGIRKDYDDCSVEVMNNKFEYVFEVYSLEVDYKKRMTSYRKYSKKRVMNEFIEIDSWNQAFDMLDNCPDNSDGIVIHAKNGFESFKIKPHKCNTVDLLYKKIGMKDGMTLYAGYCSGTIQQKINSVKSNSKFNPYASIEEPFNNLILFESPYYHDLNPIMSAQSELDGKIVESRIDDTCIVPLRVRKDLDKPNNITVGLLCAELEFYPLREQYEMKHSFFPIPTAPDHNLDHFKECCHLFRDIAFNKALEACPSYHHTCFDICGGRGADISRILCADFFNVFTFDVDKDCLRRYTNKFHVIASKSLITKRKKLTYNAVELDLATDSFDILESISDRRESKSRGISIIYPELVVLNYCLPYVNLKRLKQQLSVFKNAVVVCLYHDTSIFDQVDKDHVLIPAPGICDRDRVEAIVNDDTIRYLTKGFKIIDTTPKNIERAHDDNPDCDKILQSMNYVIFQI